MKLTEYFRSSFSDFALHLHTNTIGPIICARKLVNLHPESPPCKVVFISSDSGSTTVFRDDEDGFGAYSASKAALNQMLRHMAAELTRRGGKWKDTCVLAMHPGEVQTYVKCPLSV
jgi:NAD(P)-dependent dehydrogenase (short-subunit alcohol dehydrogenase family)